MAHNIDMSNGRANIAFLGDRADIWHRLGQEMSPGQTVTEWAAAAGLAWTAIKVPALAALTGPAWDHIEPAKRFMEVEGQRHVVRSDNGRPLGYVSESYQPVQPAEVLDWFQRYVGVDDRFALDCAGSLKNGEIIWATATFREKLDVVGDAHVARLLMTTTFDGSGSTINKATIAAGFKHYKAMAEGMVQVKQSASDVSQFFKGLLDIPFDAKSDDVSGRKLNQFQALSNAYRATVQEGTESGTGWTALNAVTRWVDHARSTRGGDNKIEAQVLSANFGSGAALKAKAVELILPNFRVPELAAA